MAGMRDKLRSMIQGVLHAVIHIGARWWRDSHSRSAAALAFYSLFSLLPILMVATRLASLFIGRSQAETEAGQAARMFFDEDSSRYLGELLTEQATPAFTGVSSVLGFCVLLFAASKVMAELRTVLTDIFGSRVRVGKRGTIIGIILGRAVPAMLVIAFGAVLAVSSLLDAALKLVEGSVDSVLEMDIRWWIAAREVLAMVFMTVLFALILRLLPPRPPLMKEAFLGALVSCVLYVGLKSLAGVYFEQSSLLSAYGAAVTLAVVLVWIYLAIQIFIIGAETAAYLGRHRRGEE